MLYKTTARFVTHSDIRCSTQIENINIKRKRTKIISTTMTRKLAHLTVFHGVAVA